MSPTQSASGSVLFELPIRGSDGSKGQVTCTEPSPQVYLLTFASGPDNRLITPFCRALILALDIIEHRHSPGVVITTSAVPKFYSNGMDIEHSQFTRAYMPDTLYALWHRLLTYPRPTIALINGHAFAGGMMVAMMHDYRVMNPHKGYLCLNELELGLPLRPPMLSVFRMKLSAATLRKMLLEAYRFKALDALKEGIVDHVGGLNDTLAFVEDLQLVKKAHPGGSGRSVYGELKREMCRETVDLLEGWAEEHVRDWKTAERSRGENKSSLANVEAWERTKARLRTGALVEDVDNMEQCLFSFAHRKAFSTRVMATDISKDFRAALANIGETRSDCVVKCGEVTFKLHKLILHLHSPFFATRLSERWEATSTTPGVVELDDEDPDVLRAVFDYFYKFTYDVLETTPSEQAFHVKVYKAADQFSIPSLATHAYSRLAVLSGPGAWNMKDFTQVASLLDGMAAVPAAKSIKDFAILVLKRKVTLLVGDVEWFAFMGDHPDWINDVLIDLAAELAESQESQSSSRPSLQRSIS